MPNVSPLHELVLLYLAIVQGEDDDLSYAEREAITDTLHSRYAYLERAEVQNVVLETLATHEVNRVEDAARKVVTVLEGLLTEEEKKEVLSDLSRIARADGLILDRERRLISAFAATWGLEVPLQVETASPEAADVASWKALDHLAYVYLVLAHAPDSDFSEDEREIILVKLSEWAPSLDPSSVKTILEGAIQRYARGPNPERLAASVDAVKSALPAAQRKTALRDLVQIANADGVFLDSEEELLNELAAAWGLDAFGVWGSDDAR